MNDKWYDKRIDWLQMDRLYNWVDTRRNIFLLYVGALPRPLLAKFTSIYLNTSWFYSIYLNLSRFTSIYHGLPQFTHRWRCKQMVFKQLQITHEWQTSCKTCHKMALLTDINHTLWKVNHYVTKSSKKVSHSLTHRDQTHRSDQVYLGPIKREKDEINHGKLR